MDKCIKCVWRYSKLSAKTVYIGFVKCVRCNSHVQTCESANITGMRCSQIPRKGYAFFQHKCVRRNSEHNETLFLLYVCSVQFASANCIHGKQRWLR